MKEALGCSLHETNRPLYDAVDKLFQMRNKIVHEGRTYSPQEMREVIKVAKKAFEWLEAVPSAAA